MKVWSHFYPSLDVQLASDYTGGTEGLCKMADQMKKPDDILMSSVAFMAEDVLCLAPEGSRVFLPFAIIKAGKEFFRPRCPMVIDQGRSAVITEDILSDEINGVYINAPAYLKAHPKIDFIYNSSLAIEIFTDLEKDADRIHLYGDENVNMFISYMLKRKVKSHPEGCVCPTHNRIDLEDVKTIYDAACKGYGAENVGILIHGENRPETLRWGIEKGALISGTGGMYREVEKGEKCAYVIATEEGLVSRIKHDFPDKKILPVLAHCPNMKTITLEHLRLSKKRIKEGRVGARAVMDRTKPPYYTVEVVDEKCCVERDGCDILPTPIEIVIPDDIREVAAERLRDMLYHAAGQGLGE